LFRSPGRSFDFESCLFQRGVIFKRHSLQIFQLQSAGILRRCWHIRGRNHLDVVQRDIAFVNFGLDLIAAFEARKNLGIVDAVQHGHRVHPALDPLVADRQAPGARIHLLDFSSKRELLLSGWLRVRLRGEHAENHG
jgi:hypothetical protein